MAQSTHQRLYPQLYTADGILKSSLTPSANFNGSGTGVDSLNLAGPNGKGTGMDLANGGIDSLFEMNADGNKIDMGFPVGPAGGKGDGAQETKKRKDELDSPQNILKKKTKEVKPNAPGGTGKESTADEEKDAKGMLQKFFEKYDLVSLGNAIGRGDGLLNEIERQDKEITALSTAAEEKQYQRGREGLADALSISKAEVDKLYKEGMINTTLTSRAFLFASTIAEPGTPEYSAAIRKYLEDNTSSAAGKALGLSTPQDVTQQALIQLMQKNPNFADILKSLQDENYSTTLGNSAASTDIDATAGIK